MSLNKSEKERLDPILVHLERFTGRMVDRLNGSLKIGLLLLAGVGAVLMYQNGRIDEINTNVTAATAKLDEMRDAMKWAQRQAHENFMSAREGRLPEFVELDTGG